MLQFEEESHPLQLLNNLKFSINEFLNILKQEKEEIKKFIIAQDKKSKKVAMKNAGLDEGTIDDFLIDMTEDLSSLEQSHSKLLSQVSIKIQEISCVSQNNFTFVNEEILAYSKLVTESAKAIQKLDEFKKYLNPVEEDPNKKKLTYEDYLQITNSRREAIEKETEEEMAKYFRVSSNLVNKDNLQEKLSKVISSEHHCNNILNDDKFFSSSSFSKSTCIKQLNSVADFFKYKIDDKFLDKMRRGFLAQYIVDYSQKKELWTIKVDKKVTSENFFYLEMDVSSEMPLFPGLKFAPCINTLFQEFFYKLEGNTLKIIGKTVHKDDFLKIVGMERFKDDFKLKNITLQIYCWMEDLIVNHFSNLPKFFSNIGNSEISHLKDKSKELVLLKKTLACIALGEALNEV